ncbi:hypothetical protein ES703_87491 [subsurface metagenome]
MSSIKNPYPEFLIDEASGIKMSDIRHQIWLEGYKTGKESRQVIKTVIRFQNDMVVVFDRRGEQILEYQGQYQEVRESILTDAPSEAVFAHGFTDFGKLDEVPRELW